MPYDKPMERFLSEGIKEKHESFRNTDYFAGEMKYFSQCILEGRDPETDGFEGLADVRVLEAILRSQKSHTFERVDTIAPSQHANPAQTQKLRR